MVDGVGHSRRAFVDLRGADASVVLLAVGSALSVVGFVALRAREQQHEISAFERRGKEVAASIKVGFSSPAEVINSIPPFFAAMGEVDRTAFHEFVGPAVKRHPSIAMIEWSPIVFSENRASFETSVQKEGFEGYEIREPDASGKMGRAGARPFYLPLQFIEPWSPFVSGFDVIYDTTRRERLMPAIREGHVIVSPRFTLVEDSPGVFSVTLLAPIFRRGAQLDTVEQRWTAFRGMVIEVFRIGAVLDATMAGRDLSGLELVLEDESAPADLRLLHASSPSAIAAAHDGQHLTTVEKFPVADRTWAVSVIRTAPLGTAGVAWGALVTGLLLSLVVAGMLGAKTAIERLRRAMETAQQLGQYRLVRKLGEGGMGVVYEAHHAMLRRPTAVKLLSATGSVSEAMLTRFEREVRVTSKLTHPNTIAIYDFGRTPEGVFYYAMEFLDGITFEELAAHEAPIPASRVVHLLLQVCGSLAEAHAMGVVHRDIKPANLMLCVRGGVHDFVKVLDFGLVKDLRDSTSKRESSREIVGTPQFISPEAVIAPRKEGPATDLYALAAVGYLLLTGNDVFEERSTEKLLVAHVKSIPKPPSSRTANVIPPALDALILRCLEKNPALRPASANELAEALRACEIPPWTERDAERWWAGTGKAILAKNAEQRAELDRQSIPRVAVDLRRRAHE